MLRHMQAGQGVQDCFLVRTPRVAIPSLERDVPIDRGRPSRNWSFSHAPGGTNTQFRGRQRSTEPILSELVARDPLGATARMASLFVEGCSFSATLVGIVVSGMIASSRRQRHAGVDHPAFS